MSVFDQEFRKDVSVTSSMSGEVLRFETSVGGEVIRQVLDFKERTIQEALIKLGWSSPPGYDGARIMSRIKELEGAIKFAIDGYNIGSGLAVEVLQRALDGKPATSPAPQPAPDCPVCRSQEGCIDCACDRTRQPTYNCPVCRGPDGFMKCTCK